ncbi:hypothetical protein D9619_012217 [Psilocybe cf. subviscida]|uniref:Uncharacterized protein n=1 Tax=Psilocybe cf. subviscida TaxID=2480587 RepID=A0A8H5B7E8_9AGAR|nr:hypothetical protein D9619_012217 [Psilocybe cf. subviscida]
MSFTPVSFIYIDIHNVALQANTFLNSGGRATQENIFNGHDHVPVPGTFSTVPDTIPTLSRATERRVEAQQRIRRKLEEVSAHTESTLSRLGPVASLAMAILSVVENDVSCNMRLVDLAMDAHAVAYIAVISFLHRWPRISKKTTKKLIELLDMIHIFLVKAVATGNIVARLRKIASRNQRKIKMMSMREELLSLLRQIERNDDADVMSSLNAALEHSNQ